jgi:GNAT superfamily N-acetyltransferase
MITEVSQKEFSRTGFTTGFPLTDAIVNGSQDGKIFANKDDDSNAFILHKAAFGFIQLNESHINGFVDLFEKDPLIPSYFHLYDPPSALTDELRNRPAVFNLRDRKRIRLIRREKVTSAAGTDMTTKLQALNALNLDKLDVMELGIGSKFWRSREDFLANGFGVGLFDASGLSLAACYTACVAGGMAEIDIQTLPEHRGKGYGRMVTDAFVNMSLDRGVVAGWDCFEENSASLRTAMAAGFAVQRSYQFISIFNKSRQHE